MNAFNYIIVSLLIGTGSSTLIVFLFKNWILKKMEHQFNKSIEEYKSELEKGNISYQIEKTEFAKKKFEHINYLYKKLLDRQKTVEDMYQLIGAASIIDIRQSYNIQTDLDRQLQNDIAMAGLYVDEKVIKEIGNFMTHCHAIMINVISIGENRLSKIPAQQSFLIYKVVGSDNFDPKVASQKVQEMSIAMRNSLNEITALLKSYLSTQ